MTTIETPDRAPSPAGPAELELPTEPIDISAMLEKN